MQFFKCDTLLIVSDLCNQILILIQKQFCIIKFNISERLKQNYVIHIIAANLVLLLYIFIINHETLNLNYNLSSFNENLPPLPPSTPFE